MAFEPIKKRRLYEDIVLRLEEMILTGELADGDVLPTERDLVSQFDVGRPAVREALLLLQQRGFVEISNGERARVTHPNAERLIHALGSAARFFLQDPQGVRQFQLARRIFEVGVVREVARTRDDGDLAKIAEAMDANKRAVGDLVRFSETDVSFHLQIVKALHNPLLEGIHQALSGWLTDQRNVSLRVESAEEKALQFHRRIYEAIVASDDIGAGAAMDEHLMSVEAFFWRN